ncbi:hypothetical protein EHS25_000985 [Saitozyma podzolica]|uniref:J domain-containing protein n=1 Tax=Saitozyma podzolica TaxID=1890683 RepID=A0A427YH30_9TREE|nr:hypothetical protein EHS25_000985 [Saitozyma podzolica]
MSAFAPLLWALLPSQLTHLALPYLTSSLPSLFPPAARGSPLYARNFRWAFSGIVVGYLALSFVREGGDGAVEDWYALLGVNREADDETLRKAFRGLSRTYHPDRAGSAHERTFILIRLAYETLSDPVKRYAYDRFGPDIVGWKCASVAEFMRTGVLHSSGFYLASAGFMLLLALLGKAREAAYWRNILFVLLLFLELTLLFSPAPLTSSLPLPINLLLLLVDRGRPQFLQIRLLHRVFTTLSIALTQLASVWCPPPEDDAAVIDQLASLVRAVEAEAVGAFQGEVVPMLSRTNDPVGMERAIQAEMGQVMLDRTLSSHPQIRPLWAEAIHRAPPRRHRNPSHPSGGMGRALSLAELEIARRIPLPPSPPPSPVLGPARLA